MNNKANQIIQWMSAVCSTERDRKSSDEQLLETFLDAGITERDALEFLENRNERFQLRMVAA